MSQAAKATPVKGATLAERIIAAREAAKMSQAQLAKAIGKSRSSVHEYETGAHEPRMAVVRKIAEVTEVPLSELLA